MGQTPHAAVVGRRSHWSHWYFNGKMARSPSAVTLVVRCGHHSADRYSPASRAGRPELEAWLGLTYCVTRAGHSAFTQPGPK